MKTLSVSFDVQVEDDVTENHFAQWVAQAIICDVLEANENFGNLEVREVAE